MMSFACICYSLCGAGPLSNVDTLSDDEPNNGPPIPRPKRMTFPRMPARGFRKKVSMYCRSQSSNDPGYLANLIRSKCGCKARCFSAFTSNPNHLESWKRMRVTLAGMTKLEKDQHVRASSIFYECF